MMDIKCSCHLNVVFYFSVNMLKTSFFGYSRGGDLYKMVESILHTDTRRSKSRIAVHV